MAGRGGGVFRATGGLLAAGIIAATAPGARADVDDLLVGLADYPATAVDPGLAGTLDPGAAAAPADPDAAGTATIPLTMYRDTEPLVELSVGGQAPVPVMFDTGSNGLTLPVSDVPFLSLFQAWDGSGTAYYGGKDDGAGYFFVRLPETVDFTTTGGQVIADRTDVDVVLFSWPSSLSSPFWSYQAGEASQGADGVLGIAPDALGPNVDLPAPTAGLPGDLGQGVLIDEPAGYVRFGAAPTDLGPGVTVAGIDDTTLGVQVNGGSIVSVADSFIDSGGVDGSIPASAVPGASVGVQLPAGTTVSVYNTDAQLLYGYTITGPDFASGSIFGNGPTVVGPTDMFNTGYEAFQQGPVYIDYTGGPGGAPTATFYPAAGG